MILFKSFYTQKYQFFVLYYKFKGLLIPNKLFRVLISLFLRIKCFISLLSESMLIFSTASGCIVNTRVLPGHRDDNMNNKTLKTVGCFAAILMVFSLFPTGALAAEDSTTKDLPMMKFGEKNRMGHGIGGGFFFSDDRPVCPVEFESEEDAFEFQKERLITSFDKRIERLEILKENLDEIGNDEITGELIDEHIVQLEDAKELISSAEDNEEINEVMESLSPIFEDMPEVLRRSNAKIHFRGSMNGMHSRGMVSVE
ncbi:Hypothetical protein Mbur_1920 [Methanococcoides burtonii DSM 6242]|uniref:DUF5667 domain-containing protein n=2 Tax=Methanococcoides burtonii TaxID=29291 RepID=Q12US4_METBU|nr:Hypothetical protein Mbur_1920 [Methanococcoides burtonii DSM 6242]